MEVVRLGTLAYHAIMADINNGVYAEYDAHTWREYYDEESDLHICVSIKNDEYSVREFEVEITDNEREYDLCDEEWIYLRDLAQVALYDNEQYARSEAEHIKHLWRTAYA